MMLIEIKKIKYLFIIGLLLTLISCSSDDDDDGVTPAPQRTADDVRADFANLTIEEGTNDLILESVIAGQYWSFRIIVPEGASDTNKMPMILRLHGGASANVPTAHTTTDCLVEPGFADMPAYIVSPNSNGYLWYEDPNIVQILALLEMTVTNLHIDTSRIAVMGYSDGGNGAFFYAQYFPQYFTAAIPMATSYATTSQSGVTHEFQDPLYVIHGSDDELFPIEVTEGYVQDSVDEGSDIIFVTAEGLNHFESCDYVPYLQDAVEWLQNEVWD